MRLIDADALKIFANNHKDGMIDSNDIARFPTIEAEPVKHGRWEQSEDEYYALCVIKCSNCKEEYCFDVSDDVEQLNYHYCPNCGAKMDGGAEA